jgi:hypothetical protein
MANYEAMIKRFFEEHLHADEEVRYCLEGSGMLIIVQLLCYCGSFGRISELMHLYAFALGTCCLFS